MVDLAVLLPLHLGGLHPLEKVRPLGLAFGPFVLLAVVAVVRRRQGIADEERAAAAEPAQVTLPASDSRPSPGE